MIITCPDCATGFKVPEAVFSSGARKVRCAQCGHSWSQELPESEPEHSDPLDDILSDSQWDSPTEEDPDDDFDDFDVAMPEFGSSSEDEDQPQTDELSVKEIVDDTDVLPIQHDIESEARGPKTKKSDKDKKPFSSKRRKWVAAVGIAASLAMLAGGAVYYRQGLSAFMPTLASVYGAIGLPVNLLGIDFARIELTRKYEDGFPVLAVQGEVVNISKTMRQIPDVRIGLSSPGGHEIYHWSINIGRAALAPDERVKFVTRLASPPEEASKIIIKFKTPRLRQVGAL